MAVKCYVCNVNEGYDTICIELKKDGFLSLVNISLKDEKICDSCMDTIILEVADKIKEGRAR